MSRFVERLFFIGFCLLVMRAFVSDEPDDPITAWMKQVGIYYWILGSELVLIGVLCILLVIAARKYCRTEARFNHIKTLKGAALVKYLAETDWFNRR